MLRVLEEFRDKLDSIILKGFGHRIVLWGYGYSGRFIAWYAEYYHSIKVDYIVEDNWERSMPYEFPLFRSSLFDFGYKDVKDAIVWLTIPEDDRIFLKMHEHGYVKGKSYFNFLEVVYGNKYTNEVDDSVEIFYQKKKGIRDVQFMEWLEHVYDCNLVTSIQTQYFDNKNSGGHYYAITTQKEIFPILDKCHCIPSENDAIFDFGCGKGGAIISFLDYGFKKAGGVEFEKKIYEVMLSNFYNLGIDTKNTVSCIYGDATKITEALDDYNWFYYFDPFEKDMFVATINNICESLKRKPRKVTVININPTFHDVVLQSGCFMLTNQFTVDMRQRVVDIFISSTEKG